MISIDSHCNYFRSLSNIYMFFILARYISPGSKCLEASGWGVEASHQNEAPRNRFLLLSIGKTWNDTSWIFFYFIFTQCNSTVKYHCKEGEKYDFFCVLTVSFASKALGAGLFFARSFPRCLIMVTRSSPLSPQTRCFQTHWTWAISNVDRPAVCINMPCSPANPLWCSYSHVTCSCSIPVLLCRDSTNDVCASSRVVTE